MKTASWWSGVGACVVLSAAACGESRDFAVSGSGGEGAGGGNATGGATGTTGGSSAGGSAAQSGGASTTGKGGGETAGTGGGSNGTGGAKSSGTGGTEPGTTGGTSAGGTSTGGSVSMGGASAGGSTGTGGASSGGGTSTGGASTGGTKSTGGTSSTGGTGGTKSTGGVSSTGGAKSTGGTSSTGGVTGTGGSSSDACTAAPCKNAGVCNVTASGYTCTCTGGFTGATCTTPIFQAVPALSGTTDGCLASGVSGDGTVVVGYCTAGTLSRAFRAQSGTTTELPPLSGGNSARALGVNRNGLTIVGSSKDASGATSAARWSGDVPLNYQGILQANYSNRAVRTNADGSISVGVAMRAGEYDTGVRWSGTGTAPTNLAAGQGHEYSFATGVDSTGNTVVGYCTDETAGFIWTAAGGFKALLGTTGGTDTRAEGVSDDGKVVAGSSAGTAVRWVNGAAQPESLGAQASPRSLSSDGSVIVGQIGTQAFIWNAAKGMRTLSTVLTPLGVTLTGWVLQAATDVSDDGTIIVGYGTLNGRQTGFRVMLPAGS